MEFQAERQRGHKALQRYTPTPAPTSKPHKFTRAKPKEGLSKRFSWSRLVGSMRVSSCFYSRRIGIIRRAHDLYTNHGSRWFGSKACIVCVRVLHFSPSLSAIPFHPRVFSEPTALSTSPPPPQARHFYMAPSRRSPTYPSLPTSVSTLGIVSHAIRR